MNILSLILATFLGALFGVVLAIVINSILIEVSIHAFFNVYYGILFLVFGSLLLVRINSRSKISGETSGGKFNEMPPMGESKQFTLATSGTELVIGSQANEKGAPPKEVIIAKSMSSSSPASGAPAQSCMLSPEHNL